ncbi:MAG: TolC family protein, partial [Sphingobacteriales bacterium]
MLASFKKVRVYITFTLLFPLHLSAQTRLEQYIERGIQDNKGLKQMQFQLDKSLHALKEASSYFLPAVSLQGNYLRSSGGRTIDFPIGDLLNPVYNSLNELTQSNQFPSLRNESIQLNPDNFYDLKVHTTL